MNKRIGLTVAIAAFSILVSGCEKKATGQVVAVVNGEEITQQELNAEVEGVNIPPSVDKKLYLSQVLQRLIDRKLLVQKAKAAGLDKSTDYLVRSRRLQEDLAVSMLSSNAAKAIPLPDGAAVSRFIASNPALFTGRKRYVLDQISIPQSTDVALLKQLEPQHTLDGVAATLTAGGVGFQRAPATLDTATTSAEVAAKIAALPPGEPFVLPMNGRYLISVIKSEQAIPTNAVDAKPVAIELLRNQTLQSTMEKQLAAARTAAKIEYQAGFGPPPAKPNAPGAKPAAPAPVASPTAAAK